MANQILARLGIVMGVDSGELEIGLNAAKEKFKGFTQEVTRQTNEAARQTIALKMATESYGKTLTEVEKLELELRYGRLAGNMVEEKTLSLLRQQAAAYDAVKAAADKANKAKTGGLTAQQQAALGYQTTDIVTSLAGGQNPFMVMLQQGGQLKDQFGGFKPMFAGIAEAITLTKVAVVGFGSSVAAVAYAMYQGREEQKQFNNSMILTGHYLTMTETQFTSLSRSISSKYNVSLSDTRAAMQAVASTGNFTATSFSSVAEVVARLSKLTGETASTIAGNLTPSFDGSASSAKRLNDQYHFLSIEQYKQIRQLEAQGRLQESIKLTADALNTSLSKQKDELGLLDKAWISVTQSVANFWQSMKDIGKKSDLDKQMEVAWNAIGIALRRAESENATEYDKQLLAAARARYEQLALERGQKIAEDAKAAAESQKNQTKIEDIASGRAATRRAKEFELDKLRSDEKFNLSIQTLDKISEIEARRVKERSDTQKQYIKMNLDEENAFSVQNANLLAEQLRQIDVKANREKEEVYAKARESYRVSAQAEQDIIDKEKERIAFYKEHILLQGTDLEIALTRQKTEQEIAAIYAKKDNGKEKDKADAADRLRDIQKQREAVIDQGIQLKMLQDMNQSVYSNMGSALDNFVRTGKLSFKDLTRSIIMDLISIYMKAQMLAMFKGFNFFGGSKGFQDVGGMGAASNDYLVSSGILGSASGGPLNAGQPSIVGENGPEIFVPKGAGTIIPNTGDLSGVSMGQSIVYNGPYIASMSAIDTQSGIQFLSKNKQAVWAANQSAQRSLPASR